MNCWAARNQTVIRYNTRWLNVQLINPEVTKGDYKVQRPTIYDSLVRGLRDCSDELIRVVYQANIHPLASVLQVLDIEHIRDQPVHRPLKIRLGVVLPSLQYFMNGNMYAC